MVLSWWLSGKESAGQCKRRRFDPQVGKIPWRRKWQPIPLFLPGKCLGQRSLVGYNLWGQKRVRHDWASKQHHVPSTELVPAQGSSQQVPRLPGCPSYSSCILTTTSWGPSLSSRHRWRHREETPLLEAVHIVSDKTRTGLQFSLSPKRTLSANRLLMLLSFQIPWIRRTQWRRKWQPTPVFLPGKVHGQRSLAGCRPWGYMTEHVCMRVEGHGLVAINW